MGEKIRVDYNPYIKKMEIKRWSKGEYVNFSEDSNLSSSYDEVIMQDKIEEILNGIKNNYSIDEMEFCGTKNDYEDFRSVSKLFCDEEKIKLGDSSRKNGKDAFEEVKNCEKEINELIEDFMNSRKSQTDEIEQLRNEIKKIEKPEINICFIGNYSTGKSTFINAIIGRNLLPSNEFSETKKIWMIHKISDNLNETVEETINGVSFNDENMKALIEEAKENNNEDINISLRFKESKLKSDDFSYILLDTPGDDNAIEEHFDVLEKCLSSQTGSLPIIVTCPNKLQSTSSKELFGRIFKNRGNIDLSRGLLVINQAENMNDDDKKKCEDTIKAFSNREEYKLPERVFYLAAKYALKQKCPDEKLGTSDDYNFKAGNPEAIKLPIFNSVQDGDDDDGSTLYNVGLNSIENAINNFAEKYAYYEKTHQYAKKLTEIIDKIIEVDESERQGRKEELTKYLNNKAETLIDRINSLAKDKINEYWPEKKEAKSNLKKRSKQYKNKEFVTILEEYYTEKIRDFEKYYSESLEEELKKAYDEIGNKINNSNLTDRAKDRIKKVLEERSNEEYKPINVELTKKILFISINRYKRAIDDADEHKSGFINKIQNNITDKINAECKKVIDLRNKENNYCSLNFEADDFYTKDLTDKIKKLEKIKDEIGCYCDKEK